MKHRQKTSLQTFGITQKTTTISSKSSQTHQEEEQHRQQTDSLFNFFYTVEENPKLFDHLSTTQRLTMPLQQQQSLEIYLHHEAVSQ